MYVYMYTKLTTYLKKCYAEQQLSFKYFVKSLLISKLFSSVQTTISIYKGTARHDWVNYRIIQSNRTKEIGLLILHFQNNY